MEDICVEVRLHQQGCIRDVDCCQQSRAICVIRHGMEPTKPVIPTGIIRAKKTNHGSEIKCSYNGVRDKI
jgi:hypothetical protein